MKPQQSVYNMLAKADKAQKQEFGSMKVELSLVSELITRVQESKAQAKSLRDAELKLMDIFDEASRLSENLNNEYGFALSLTSVITASIDRVETAAKELGLDLNSIKEIKDIKSAEQDLLTAMGKAKNTINAYQSIR